MPSGLEKVDLYLRKVSLIWLMVSHFLLTFSIHFEAGLINHSWNFSKILTKLELAKRIW